MVLTSKKWMCGEGEVTWYYCEICNTPHASLEEALKCEKSHIEE